MSQEEPLTVQVFVILEYSSGFILSVYGDDTKYVVQLSSFKYSRNNKSLILGKIKILPLYIPKYIPGVIVGLCLHQLSYPLNYLKLAKIRCCVSIWKLIIKKSKFVNYNYSNVKTLRQWQRRILPNFYAYKLRFSGRDLTWEENGHFINCVNQIYKTSEHVIFRGDKKTHLQKIYGVSGTWSPDRFNNSIFFFGTKSRLYSLRSEIRQRALNISAGSRDTFSRLFKMIRELLLTKGSRELRDALDKFTQDNGPLVSYFLDADNEEKFKEATNKLSFEQKIKLRDNYLTLLHHIGAGKYFSETFMLSTTVSFSKACEFANGNKSGVAQSRIHDSIVIVGWVPAGLENIIQSRHGYKLRAYDSLNIPGIPVYKETLFPSEQEITLKGGFFPHHMLGYLHWENGNEIFEVNPALFAVDMHWDGKELPVDQSTWEERIRLTEFGAYFQLHDDRFFSQQEVSKS